MTEAKRGPGRPRKSQPAEPIQETIPETIPEPGAQGVFVSTEETNLATNVDNEAPKEAENADIEALKSIFQDHHAVGEETNDLLPENQGEEDHSSAAEEPEPEMEMEETELDEPVVVEIMHPALPGFFFIEEAAEFPDARERAAAHGPVVRNAAGDLAVTLVIREAYVQSFADQAEAEGVAMEEVLQRLLDWWVENEFTMVTAK